MLNNIQRFVENDIGFPDVINGLRFVTVAECCLLDGRLFVHSSNVISHKNHLTKLANMTIIPP